MVIINAILTIAIIGLTIHLAKEIKLDIDKRIIEKEKKETEGIQVEYLPPLIKNTVFRKKLYILGALIFLNIVSIIIIGYF